MSQPGPFVGCSFLCSSALLYSTSRKSSALHFFPFSYVSASFQNGFKSSFFPEKFYPQHLMHILVQQLQPGHPPPLLGWFGALTAGASESCGSAVHLLSSAGLQSTNHQLHPAAASPAKLFVVPTTAAGSPPTPPHLRRRRPPPLRSRRQPLARNRSESR